MIKKKKAGELGFTIVELLVVIVIIGVLAAITVVSYTGISQRAKVASMQADLSTISTNLKMFYTDKGYYPSTISTNCASNPDSDTNKCIKVSPGNTIELCDYSSSSSFSLLEKNGDQAVIISDGSSPVSVSSLPNIFSSGGTIDNSRCVRTHTFTPGSYPLTAVSSGSVDIVVSGAGGGGSAMNWDDCWAGYTGENGAQSKITIASNNYIAYGGTGAPCYSAGVNGVVDVPGGFTNVANPSVGGGGAGGNGAPWDGDWLSAAGDKGGNGGKVVGVVGITSGQSVDVLVGAGGAGGENGLFGGSAGDAGEVIIKYKLYQ